MKPPRPSIAFRSYKTESSATVVDDQPWFAVEPLQALDEAFSVRTMVAVAPAPLPSPPPALAAPPAAPAWALPALPVLSVPIVERRELPSFGPVAFDVVHYDESWDREARTVRVARRGHHPLARAAAYAAAALMGLATIGGGRALIESRSVEPASAVAPDRAQEQEQEQEQKQEQKQQPDFAAPPSPLTPVEPVRVDVAFPLTPEELFPKKSAMTAAPALPGEKLSAAQCRVQKARMAADLARRNAPTLPSPAKSLRRGSAPSVDDILRAASMRGQRD